MPSMPSGKLLRNIFGYFIVTTSKNADSYVHILELKAETVVPTH